MSPVEISRLMRDIRRCRTCLLTALHAGMVKAGTAAGLRAAALIDEELRTRRELEALCVAGNRVESIAVALSMPVQEVYRRWRRMRIAPAVAS